MTATVMPFNHDPQPLLGPDDDPPFEIVNPEGRAAIVVFCDHASFAVPRALDGLGLDESLLKRHIGWDIGAGDVTRRLAGLLDAPAVLCGYSRLVIDCNRPPGEASSIPHISDDIAIPGNEAVDDAARAARAAACFWPYHAAVDDVIDGVTRRAGPPAAISMHSFTPMMDGFERPWHVGMLWDRNAALTARTIARLRRDAALHVGDNEPYSGEVPPPYSIPRHCVANNLDHLTFEIRQDLIDTHHGAETWANIIAAAVTDVLREDGGEA